MLIYNILRVCTHSQSVCICIFAHTKKERAKNLAHFIEKRANLFFYHFRVRKLQKSALIRKININFEL